MKAMRLPDLLNMASQQVQLAACLYSGAAAVRKAGTAKGAHAIYVEHGHTAAAAWVFRDHVHLSICGTNDPRDWYAQNLDAHQMVVHGHKAHRGLATSAALLYVQLMKAGLTGLLTGRDLIIGGHSAGGAIAELLALEPGMTPTDVITFGSPRVFAADAAATYRVEKTWRVSRFVVSGDPVPGLPLRKFRLLFDGAAYSHTSAAMELTADGRVLLDQEISTWRKALRYVLGWWLYLRLQATPARQPMPPRILANHHLSRYSARLAAALNGAAA